jgi:hypothetical protein
MHAKPKAPRPPSFADRFDQIRALLDRLVPQVRALRAQMGTLMPVLADIQAKIATLTTAVAANTQVDGSIVTLLNGLTAMIAALKQQLADAIASNDPVALQASLDGLTAVETAITANTQKLADAAVQNTPA